MKKRIFPISMAVIWGITFGVSMDSWTGVCLGLIMGMAFGLFDSEDIGDKT